MTISPGEAQYSQPQQSPLFHAHHSSRYERQELIRAYETLHNCRLVVMIDAIFPASVTLFEDLIYDANVDEDLHLLLSSPGGDGETAVRLARVAQARCHELTVIVPDIAKSAATLLALGAHHILMSATSDLGPVDPQFNLGGQLTAAKDIIAAVEDAAKRVQEAPDTYPLYASLLSNVDAIIVQRSRSAMNRTEDLISDALRSNPNRDAQTATDLKDTLKTLLVVTPQDHGALFGVKEALDAGLPVQAADVNSTQWQMLWRLWAKYYALETLQAVEGSFLRVYEGRRVSWVMNVPPEAL